MDKTARIAEPIAYDAADQIEATGITPLEAGRKLVAVGLSRIRASVDDKHELSEELHWLSEMLADEAAELLRHGTQ